MEDVRRLPADLPPRLLETALHVPIVLPGQLFVSHDHEPLPEVCPANIGKNARWISAKRTPKRSTGQFLPSRAILALGPGAITKTADFHPESPER
jgi:hypothetical protein